MFTTTLRVAIVGILSAALIAAPANATNRVPGNNGTLKVHEQGTPSQFINNDPKVCNFNFEGYNFDLDQDGLVVITTQGGGNDRSEVKRVYMPAATAADTHGTYTETEYLTLPNGHYKTTVYGKDKHGAYNIDLKAKSKVFKVQCDSAVVEDEDTVATPGNPTENDNNGVGAGSDTPGQTSSTSTTTPNTGQVAGTATDGGKGGATPEVLPATGTNPLQGLLNTLFLGAGIYTALLRRKLAE